MDEGRFTSSVGHVGATAVMPFQPRIRKSAYFNAARRHGCKAFTVYNRTYISLGFDDPEAEYWQVIREVALWPAAGQRQMEISGRDALAFTQLLTPRRLAECAVGQCKYVPMTDEAGGVINDPVLLRLAEDRFWLSASDSDILLWAKGVAVHSGLEVALRDANVTVAQIQGPKSVELMAAIFGPELRQLGYYRLTEGELDGIPLVISRTGWSGERGYELYLGDAAQGDRVFDRLLELGERFGLRPGSTSQMRRIEAGLLSFGADMTGEENPFELGLGRLVDLEQEADFIGKAALARIARQGVRRRLVGLRVEGARLAPNIEPWPLACGGKEVGRLTSLAWSPRLECNIALGMTGLDHARPGTRHEVATPDGAVAATVQELPFVPRRQTG